MSRAHANRSPALIASAVLHAAVIAAAVIAWPFFSKPLLMGQVVPVTIITSAPPAEEAPAVPAAQPQPAMSPAPAPEAPAQPAPAPPTPPAPPPKPAAMPKPAPKPTQAKPAPALKPAAASAKASPKKDDFDLDTLMASITSSRRASRPSTSGQPGPSRPATGSPDSKGADDHMSASELGALNDKLGRLWNPNCQVEGGRGIIVRVHVRLSPQGYVIGQPELPDRAKIFASGNPVLIAAATRALSAVERGQPYTDVLNPDHYSAWRDMILTMDPKNQCS